MNMYSQQQAAAAAVRMHGNVMLLWRWSSSLLCNCFLREQLQFTHAAVHVTAEDEARVRGTNRSSCFQFPACNGGGGADVLAAVRQNQYYLYEWSAVADKAVICCLYHRWYVVGALCPVWLQVRTPGAGTPASYSPISSYQYKLL